MTRLQRIWKQINDNEKNRLELIKKLNDLQLSAKQNLELQEYIKLCNELEILNSNIESLKKDELFYEMEKHSDTSSELNGKYLQATLVKSYKVVNIDRNKFLKDFAEDSEMYKKYTILLDKKGHVNLKSKIKEGG